MSYLLRKWYFDFLTPQGEYAYIYFAYMRLAGSMIRSLTVHAAGAGTLTTRSFLLSRHEEDGGAMAPCNIRFPCGGIRVGEHLCALDFDREDTAVHLRFEDGTGDVGAPVCIPTGNRTHIFWKPAALRYGVTGEVALGGARISPAGATGYADLLESTCLPPLVRARTLYWGRAHHPAIDFAYTHARAKNGTPVCSTLILKRAGASHEATALSFLPSPPGLDRPRDGSGELSYTLGGETNNCRMSARVRRVRPVQHSGFIDQQEIRSGILRSAVRIFTRNPRSTKFLSSAALALGPPAGEAVLREVPLIDEIALL